MPQNIYDNEEFYQAYLELRKGSKGLNDVLEIPAFRSLLPDLRGKTILDLGCGYGESSMWYVTQGARHVVGVDISAKMLSRAQELYQDRRVEYVRLPMEEIHFPRDHFDVVVSSLAFHYVEDYTNLIKRVYHCLKPGGFLVFSQEHPVTTAKQTASGWYENSQGEKLHWVLDHYQEEGRREQHWFVDGVVKYHRTMATVMNTLLDAGFSLVRVLEPTPLNGTETGNPELINERRRPPFLMVKVQKCYQTAKFS